MRLTCVPTLALAGALASACGDIAKPSDVDARTDPYVYAGHLDATPPVNFGQAPTTCTWTMTLKNIDVRVTVSVSNVIVGTEVTSDHVEAFVSGTAGCMTSVVPLNHNVFSLASLQPTSTGSMITLKGAATNVTKADVTVDLAPGSGGYAAALTFHRNDLGAPYDWKVSTMLTLSRI